MMPLDIELIRELMLRFEQDDTSVPEGRTEGLVAYHVLQMKEDGLIDAFVRKRSHGNKAPDIYRVHDITPKGRKFIASIKPETLWSKLKDEIQRKSVPLTVELIVQSAKLLSM